MSRIVGEIVYFVRIGGEIVERFGRTRFEELLLGRVEFTSEIKFTPLGEGRLLVAILVVKAVEIEWLVISAVAEISLSQRADEVVFFVKSIGVSE